MGCCLSSMEGTAESHVGAAGDHGGEGVGDQGGLGDGQQAEPQGTEDLCQTG